MISNYMEFLSSVETGCITDAMCMAGVEVGWMDGIYPTAPDMKICGRAFTVQYELKRYPEQKTYSLYEIFDMCEPGDVVVIASYNKRAMVGDNMMTAIRNKKLAGMVLDGRTRDSRAVAALGVPQFTAGRAIGVADHNFRVTAYQIPIIVGGVRVSPGDYIIGDNDGVIALAPDNLEKVIYQCEKVVEYEEKLASVLASNIPIPDLLKIYAEKNVPRK